MSSLHVNVTEACFVVSPKHLEHLYICNVFCLLSARGNSCYTLQKAEGFCGETSYC